MALCVNTDGCHRRKVWTAWEQTPVDRRWAALLAAGAKIRAACPLTDHQAYSHPRPLEHRQQQIAGAPAGVYQTITIDPEDGPPPVEPIPPSRKSRRMVSFG